MEGNAMCAEILLYSQDIGLLFTEVPVMCKTTALPMPTKCNGSVLLLSVTQVKAQAAQVQCSFPSSKKIW